MRRIFRVLLLLLCPVATAWSQELCERKPGTKAWSNEAIVGAIAKAGYGAANTEVKEEDNNAFLRVWFPKGSVDPAGVARLGSPLGGVGTLLSTAPVVGDCLWMGYRLRFAPDFEFVKGGKLPGLAGGRANTGGKIPNGRDGFSARFMWRDGGKGEVYAYLPDSVEWGTSLGRGKWLFLRGVWNRIEQLVKLNQPGLNDGYIGIWVNGFFVFEARGLRFRDINELRIDGLQFETFFGGNTFDWASANNTYIDFKELSVAFARENLIDK